MSDFFQAAGKRVLADGRYYADAVDSRAARFIALACNRQSAREELAAEVRIPVLGVVR